MPYLYKSICCCCLGPVWQLWRLPLFPQKHVTFYGQLLGCGRFVLVVVRTYVFRGVCTASRPLLSASSARRTSLVLRKDTTAITAAASASTAASATTEAAFAATAASATVAIPSTCHLHYNGDACLCCANSLHSRVGSVSTVQFPLCCTSSGSRGCLPSRCFILHASR